jgi:hypothetical protein
MLQRQAAKEFEANNSMGKKFLKAVLPYWLTNRELEGSGRQPPVTGWVCSKMATGVSSASV